MAPCAACVSAVSCVTCAGLSSCVRAWLQVTETSTAGQTVRTRTLASRQRILTLFVRLSQTLPVWLHGGERLRERTGDEVRVRFPRVHVPGWLLTWRDALPVTAT